MRWLEIDLPGGRIIGPRELMPHLLDVDSLFVKNDLKTFKIFTVALLFALLFVNILLKSGIPNVFLVLLVIVGFYLTIEVLLMFFKFVNYRVGTMLFPFDVLLVLFVLLLVMGLF